MPRYRAMTGWMGGLRLRAPRLDSLDALIVAAAALGAALVLARMDVYGVGLNYDSLYYIEVARNALEGEGFVSYDGTPHTVWPPGYPLLLAAAGLGIIDPHTMAAPMNAVLFGLTILVTGRYLRRRLEMGFLALWACLAIALALPLADLARFAMPGMAFILFATLALIQTDRALRDDRWAALVWAAVFCALAWQMRYIGAAVPALAGLALLLQGGLPLSRRMRRAAFLAAVAGAPMALWLLRNYLAKGRLFTAYDAGDFSLSRILWDTAQIVASWQQPLPGWLSVLVLAALIVSLGVVIARGDKARARRACLIFGGFGLAYVALLSAALALGAAFNGLQPRYVAVLYVPLVAIATFALDGLLGWARARRGTTAGAGEGGQPYMRTFAGVFRLDRLLAIALGIGLCAWIAVQAVANADHIARVNSGELYLGHAGPRWTESETLRYLRERLSGATIYTNLQIAPHFHNDGNADYRGLFRLTPNNEDFRRWVAENEGAYVAWLDDHNPEQEFRIINMRALAGLEPIAKFADGEAFRVNGEYKLTPGSNPYMDAYLAVESGAATRHSFGTDFEVYTHQDRLIYFKDSCEEVDTQARFRLHIFPDDASDLPAARKWAGFENLDFEFERSGALFRDNCIALMPLPRYEYERIVTGQYARGAGALWRAEVAGTSGRRYRQAHKSINDGDYGGAAARSNFAIYLDEGAESKSLVYIKEPCVPDDTRARFFLHVYPDDASDLPADGARHGFENLDFQFSDYGLNWGEICVAARELPRYEYERISTGQHVRGAGALWRAEVAGTYARRYRQAHRAASEGDYGSAAAQSNFDVYLDDNDESKALIYVKERCAAEDTQARFFLHIIPSDAADLPADRKGQGFDNLDFQFAEYGANLGEACVAVRELPEYGVDRIRTGQHISGEGAVWRVEFGVSAGE